MSTHHSSTPTREAPAGVIAIVRMATAPPDDVLTTLEGAGITAIEVTLPTPGAVETISRWRERRSAAQVGAGTVRTIDDARHTIDAGAEFLVTPTCRPDVICSAAEVGIPTVAGALTPTEIDLAWSAGAAAVKVFPADAVGADRYVRAVRAPLPEIRLVPTGGVDPASTKAYARLGAYGVGVGSELVDDAIVAERDWDELRNRAVRFVDTWRASSQSGQHRSTDQ